MNQSEALVTFFELITMQSQLSLYIIYSTSLKLHFVFMTGLLAALNKENSKK